jgi:hypothetical protein
MRSTSHRHNLPTCIPLSRARCTGSRALRRRGWALVALAFTVVLLISPRPAGCQSPEEEARAAGPIVTDRPTDSAAPVVVPRRTFQLEFGYKWSRLDDDSGRADSHVLPDLLARYGISRRVEARLVAPGWSFQSSDMDLPNGFNDISLGAKFALAEERGLRPQMALLVDLSLPVGDDEFTNDEVIPKVLFLGANTLTDRLGLTYNVGPSVVTSAIDCESESNVDLNYAVALSGSTGGPVSLFGEFFGAFVSGSDRSNRHNFQTGTTVLLSPLVQIDFRGGVGLVDNEPDWFVGAGFAFRIPH